MLGSSDALSLPPPKPWTVDLERLVRDLAYRVPLIIVEIPPTRSLIDLPRFFETVVDARVQRLNRATRETAAGVDLVSVIPFPPPAASADGRNSTRTFELWARLISRRPSAL